MKLLKDWLTGPDNDHFELWRAMALAGFIVGISLVIYSVGWRGETFDLLNYAQGLGFLLAHSSGGVALKDFAASKARSE